MDKRLFAAVAVTFLFLVGWILDDMGVISISIFSNGQPEKPAIGKVSEKRKTVQRRIRDSLVWDDIDANQNIFAYDSVLTLSGSTALIAMNDGSAIDLDENSLITILPPQNSQDPLTLNLSRGRYKIALKRGKSIKVGEVTVQSREDAEVTFKVKDDNQTHVEVSQGLVNFVNPLNIAGPEKVATLADVKSGQEVTINTSGTEAKVEEFQPEPKKEEITAVVPPVEPLKLEEPTDTTGLETVRNPSESEETKSQEDTTSKEPAPPHEPTPYLSPSSTEGSNAPQPSTDVSGENQNSAITPSDIASSSDLHENNQSLTEPADAWAWPVQRYTVWVGASWSFLSYSQTDSVTSTVEYQSLSVPSEFLGEFRFDENWGVNLFYESSHGSVDFQSGLTVSTWDYSWQKYGGEVTYTLLRDSDSMGLGHELVGTLGVEFMNTPFVVPLGASTLSVITNKETILNIGAEFNINSTEHLRYEFGFHYDYPLTSSSTTSDSITLKPTFGADISVGVVYRITPHIYTGLGVTGNYFQNNYDFHNATFGTNVSGSQNFFYLSTEFKFGYNF